jgi:hypothetical protein
VEASRELDRMIAEQVFGRDPLNARVGLHADGDLEYHWGYPHGHDRAPAYSTDIAAAMAMEAEIERRGLQTVYLDALLKELGLQEHVFVFNSAIEINWWNDIDGYGVLWRVLRATPEQRCIAVLAAVRAGETNAPQ